MDNVPSTLPVLPIRNAVLFPSISMPLVVGRARSLEAVHQSEATNNLLEIVTQKILTSGDPTSSDLNRIGTLCKIESSSPTDTGSRQIVVTGIARYSIAEFQLRQFDNRSFLTARGEVISDTHTSDSTRNRALLNNLKSLAEEILELTPGGTEPLARLIDKVDDPAYLTHVTAAYLNLSLDQKQDLLETTEVEKRIEILLDHLRREREVLNLQREIRDKMSERLNKTQREALLREQMRTIRTELGEEANEEGTEDLEEKIRKAELPEEPARQAAEEIKRLRILPSASAEYHVIRTYIEWLAAMPWKHFTPDNIDIEHARKILDEDHYGLNVVKRRILQFLAVAKLKNNLHGPILCLVGPPGVGKTSLGQSIARTLGRKFIRTSLGGVRDEAEIRGHRRTYVGAMPGRIIQSIKRVGTKNPLMMLDEIDKLRADFHGDPAAAMLEVLDPEQNKSFTDHYLDVPFDLSDIFFITTANMVDTIPAPLRDRMEIIEVNGYTTVEKLEIAKRHLLPKQLQAHGISMEQITLSDEAMLKIITNYTREAGVRELDRKIAALLCAAAEEIVARPADTGTKIDLSSERLRKLLGPERFSPEMAERIMKPGIATGLAWTPQGGEILFIEATRMPGKGNLILTGQLGDVMKESAQIALSLAKSPSSFAAWKTLPTERFDFSSSDLHIHVPAGAIPKDGPSAGIAMLTTIVSVILDCPINADIAMTGEITLRGAVLPVGGIKEKILAAHRAQLKIIILPKRNEQDLEEVPEDVRKQMQFIFVDSIDELLPYVFKDQKVVPYFLRLNAQRGA